MRRYRCIGTINEFLYEIANTNQGDRYKDKCKWDEDGSCMTHKGT